MELKLKDGTYVPRADGGLAVVTGAEELAQRVLMKLTARRGGFAPLPEYGSRLYTLHREKPSRREAAAARWVREALADEPGLTLEQVTVSQPEAGVMAIDVRLCAEGETLALTVTV